MSSDVEKRLKALDIGRFQVMALLQTARYYRLYGDLVRAKSFGLNRAVFYAWAKHYGPRGVRTLHHVDDTKLVVSGSGKCPEGYTEVLGECVKVSSRGYFEFGGVEQTPQDYDQQVTYRVRRLVDPEKVLRVALEYVSKFPEGVLRDPTKFYKYVYEPVRDTFFIELLTKGYVEPKKDIIERLHELERMLEKVREAQKSLTSFIKQEDTSGQSK